MKNRFSFLILNLFVVVNFVFAQTVPGGYQPSNCIGNCNYVWLKADAGTSTTSQSGSVSNWIDQSGNGNHATQSAIALKPIFENDILNFNPGVKFNNNHMSGSSGYSSGTQLIVYKTNSNVSRSTTAATLISTGYVANQPDYCGTLSNKSFYIPIKNSTSGAFPDKGKSSDQVILNGNNRISEGFLTMDLIFSSIPNNIINPKLSLRFTDLDLQTVVLNSGSNRLEFNETFELYDANNNLLASLGNSFGQTGAFTWDFNVNRNLIINGSITLKVRMTSKLNLTNGNSSMTLDNTLDDIRDISFCGEVSGDKTSGFKIGNFSSSINNEVYGVLKGNSATGFASGVANISTSRGVLSAQSRAINTGGWNLNRDGNSESVLSDGQELYSDWYNKNYVLGASPISASNFSDRFNGYILEVISYPTRLSTADLQKINSYLAVKYGISLGHNYVNSTGATIYNVSNHGNRVFGIGRENAQGLHQKQSRSEANDNEAMLTVGYNKTIATTNASGSNMTNNTFVMFGDDNASRSSWVSTNAPITTLSESKRISRVWKTQITGNPTEAIRVRIDGTKLPIVVTSERIAMLVSDNPASFKNATFTNASSIILPMTQNGNDWEVDYVFPAASIRYITFIKYTDCYTNLACTGSVTWDGSTWVTWDGSTWINSTPPNSFTEAVINGNYSTLFNLNFKCCKLTVNAGKTLTIHNGGIVEVQSDITNNGNIIVNNNGSLMQYYDNAVNTGNITVVRQTNDLYKFDYTYWSSPVSGFNMSNIPHNRAYYWDENTGDWSRASGIMEPTRGYILMTDNQSKTTATKTTATFIGPMNNGRLFRGLNNSKDDYNLIGNPYPSALKAADLLSDPDNQKVLGGTIYFWTHNTRISGIASDRGEFTENDYASWNLTGGVGAVSANLGGLVPNGKIASGQGFFVEILEPGEVKFTNCMRGINVVDNSKFFRPIQDVNNEDATSESEDDDNVARLWLDITNEEGSYKQLLIGYIAGATNGLDRLYDGVIMDGENKVSLYSISKDSEEKNKHLSIQGRALPFNDNDIVPLGYSLQTGVSKINTISVSDVGGDFKNKNIYLIDNQTGITHDLKSSSYTFESEPGDFEDRFELTYANRSLSITDQKTQNKDVVVASKLGIIKVQSNIAKITSVQISDMLGKQIYNNSLDQITSLIEIKSITVKNQVVIVKTTLEDGTISLVKVML